MAKAPSLADNLGKHLECAVCLEQYTDPRVLPCLHSFCKRCLQGLSAQEGTIWEINCPTCRSSAEIPQGRIDLLPVNFFVNNLLSILTLHEDSESSNLECDNCDSGDHPVNRCTTCLHFLCEFCTQGHKRSRSTRSHNLLSLEEAKKMGSVAVTKPSVCKEHEGEVIKLFCETCEEAICRDCTIVKHRDHKYTFVKDAFSKGKESLLKILSETKTKACLLKEAVDDVVEMKTNVHTCVEQTMSEIINCFNELSACLDARRGELIDKVEEFKKAKLKSLEIQQEELETALGSVESSVEFTERAFENGSEVEILNMRKQMSNRLQDLNSAKWQLEPRVDDGLEFKSGNQLKNEIATFGVVTDAVTFAGTSTVTMGNGQESVIYNTLCGQEIEFTVTAKERNKRKRMEGGDKVIFDVTAADELMEANDWGSGTYSTRYFPEIEGNWELSVKLNGHHVQGSPFTWFTEEWILEPFPSNNTKGSIHFSEENLTAEYNVGHYKVPIRRSRRQLHKGRASAGVSQICSNPFGFVEVEEDVIDDVPTVGRFFGFAPATTYHPITVASTIGDILPGGRRWTVVSPSDSQHPGNDRRPCAVGSVAFNAGRHMWKVRVFGNVLQGFSFGICSRGSVCTPGQRGNWWVWNSRWVFKVVNGGQAIARTESTITDCASGDIIEFYLDCENGALMMYNSRTKQSDTLDGVERNVVPVFGMSTNGDKVALRM